MKRITALLAALAFVLPIAQAAEEPEHADAQKTYKEIEQTFGAVPGFMRAMPAEAIEGAWQEMKELQLANNTALSVKEKELIGLAVAAQIPCQYCVYFHTAAAKANGASDEEVREAIGMSALTRHWSTVLNGSQIDMATFKQETDAALKFAGDKAKAAKPAEKKK
jgi:AhpD family alkylhydroperoxidase